MYRMGPYNSLKEAVNTFALVKLPISGGIEPERWNGAREIVHAKIKILKKRERRKWKIIECTNDTRGKLIPRRKQK
ncbi:hypothetical protein H5410_063921 [Solanum commersonii]|uniref:Uncharacterized protein n=1 Tax=Solanum commersonii TaxID=4109 RepID=A0A9J5WEI9_SOLCO|nr:hypothetical protein H5410_063921 [Solanum commersonii]